MTEKERKEQITYHREALRKLHSVSRSDWHAGFEALLRIETYKYGSRIRMRTEEVLGEEPPRADYVIIIEERNIMDTLKLTVSQAMDALKIPDADRPVYAEKLKRS